MELKQSGHHDLSTVAQIVGPDDFGLQVKNEVVRHRAETICFDVRAVAHLPNAYAVLLQGIVSTRHP